MPYINKPPKKAKSTQHNQTDMRKLRQDAYNQTAWRKLRETYLKRNPLCEECIQKGKVTPASSVHHKKSPFSKGEVNQSLFLDYNNLESICHECHAEIHNKEQGHKPVGDIIKELDALLNNEN